MKKETLQKVLSLNLKGKSMSIEGGDGGGKGTLITGLEQVLSQIENLQILWTREPGGVKISEQIRKIILDVDNEEMCPETEALLYSASRAQLMHQLIFKNLKEEKFVILDRFVDSSLVYQGIARDLGVENIKSINNFATRKWLPNLTVVLDLDPKIAQERVKSRGNEDRLDKEKLAFHETVRDGYLTLKEIYPERIFIVDANQEPEAVLEDVLKVMVAVLGK